MKKSPFSFEAAVPFWFQFRSHGNRLALIEASSGSSLNYEDLADEVERRASSLIAREKILALLPLNSRIDDILWYLAALMSGAAVLLYSEKTTDGELAGLIERFKPDLLLGESSAQSASKLGIRLEEKGAWLRPVFQSADYSRSTLDSRLGLLLATSGTIGQKKFAKISGANISASVRQINSALNQVAEDVAITNLPLTYVYGLSVLHSHLAVGATIVVESRSLMEAGFWESFPRYSVTSLSGVPSTFRLMESIKIPRSNLSSLKNVTVSGDRCTVHTTQWLEREFHNGGINVFSMYGQTEATGRIAVLPPQDFARYPASVGYPVPEGSLQRSEDGIITYRGPNVMSGYASTRCDLNRADELNGVLVTGDVGNLDTNGRLFLTGRASRIAKIYGLRFNLDEIASMVAARSPIYVGAEPGSDVITIFVSTQEPDLSFQATKIAKKIGVPAAAVKVQVVDNIEQSPNGKYRMPGSSKS